MFQAGRAFSANLLCFLGDIKLAHSVFALPFSLAALWFVTPTRPLTWAVWLALLTAIVAARSFAMGMNRFLDWRLDAANPRTALRAIPSGRLLPREALLFSCAWAALFVMASFSLSRTAGWLSLPVLLMLAGYSMIKRFSRLCHWYLGICLGLSPLGVSLAIGGSLALADLLLAIGTALWVAGFDIIYSLQDIGTDRQLGLHSMPSRAGWNRALIWGRVSFLGSSVCFVGFGIARELGILYFAAVGLIAVIMVVEHVMVATPARAYRNLNAAFFSANAWVSLLFLAGVSLDQWLR